MLMSSEKKYSYVLDDYENSPEAKPEVLDLKGVWVKTKVIIIGISTQLSSSIITMIITKLLPSVISYLKYNLHSLLISFSSSLSSLSPLSISLSFSSSVSSSSASSPPRKSGKPGWRECLMPSRRECPLTPNM